MTEVTALVAEELPDPLPYTEARTLLLDGMRPLPPRLVPVGDALGLVSAEDVVAEADVPSFESSAMDGYALRAGDVSGASTSRPVRLRLVGAVPAGGAQTHALPPAATMAVATGAAVPPGADAVVPWERVCRAGAEISFLSEVTAGDFLRPRGEDLRAGTAVVAQGEAFTPVHLGVLASIGRSLVLARPRPRVAVLSTGDELVAPGRGLGAGRRHDANGPLLRGLCEQAGASVVATAMVRDDASAVAAWLRAAASAVDLVVTTGGASVGDRDVVRQVLTRHHEVVFWRVAMKPGKPMAFARVDSTPVLALPGNPGSVGVCAHAFVLPAVRSLAGADPAPRRVRARLAQAVEGAGDRTLFCGVTLKEDLAEPAPSRSSQVLSTLLAVQGFAVVPPDGLPGGSDVWVELLG